MRNHLPFIIFFFSFMITGLFIFDDYGVSWDEAECRIDNGILNLNFIASGDEEPLLNSVSKYHGASYEMFLVALERIAGLHSTNEVFLMRHLVNFFLFALSVFFFYLLCLKAFRSQWYALAACVILVLSPRIFADSFYNSKDLSFLSFFIISVCSLLDFIEKKKVAGAFVAAFVTGFMIDIRIMGIILPALTLFFLSVEFFIYRDKRKSILISTAAFTIFLAAFIVLFWPVLWLDPIGHFMLAWSENSRYPWEGSVLYNGSLIKAVNLPWHYIPLWILMTTPPLYLGLFFTGIFVLVKKIIAGTISNRIEIISLFLVIVPLFSIIILHSVVYDGWRHLYFIYPFMVIISVEGLKAIMDLLAPKNKKYFIASITAYFSAMIFTIAEIHPFQNVYFNFIAGATASPVRERFEIDYWGLSYKQAYEYILKNDTSSQIIVYLAEGQPGTDNMLFLKNGLRSRIIITDNIELADYYLTCHRKDREIHEYTPVHHIKAGDIIVHSVYDQRAHKISLDSSNLISDFFNNYENIPVQFHPVKVVSDTFAGEVNRCEQITGNSDFGGNFSFDPREKLLLYPSVIRYMKVSVKVNSAAPFRCMIVQQVDSGNSTYHWNTKMLNNSFTNEWNSFSFIWKVPAIYNESHKYKVHLHNIEKGDFKADDFEIKFYEIDTAMVSKTLRNLPI